MVAKKVKEDEVLQNTPVEETEPTETPTEPVEPTENVNPEVAEETPAEEAQEPADEPAPVEETPEPVNEPIPEEEQCVEENHNVSVEVEKKQFSTITAPEEIRKIIDFYGVTSDDLYTWKVDEMWLSEDELKAIKEWYATLI